MQQSQAWQEEKLLWSEKKRRERRAQISFIKEISYQKPYSTAHDTSALIVKMLTSVMHYLSCQVN